MAFRRLKQKKYKIAFFAVLFLMALAASVFIYFKYVGAAFQGNVGTAAWGDTSLGRIRVSHSTWSTSSPYTSYGTSFRPGTAPNAHAIQFTVTKASPVRNEKLIGYQINDTANSNGQLYIATCGGTCSVGSDLTVTGGNTWSTTIYGANVVTRGFDIAYEQLSGRAMVVYAGNTTGKLYYCIFDGTSWGPVSNCAPTNGQNDISLTDGTTSLTGTPEWVRLVPQGGQYTDTRSNQILLVVGDTNRDYMVTKWTGSAWTTTDRQVLTTTGGSQVSTSDSGSQDAGSFDVGWETNSGLEMAVYANGTALTYRTSSGSGWSSGTAIQTLGSAAAWVRIASDPTSSSNRMSAIAAFSTTARPYIWKTDNCGSSCGWTAGTDDTMNQNVGQNIDTAWLKSNTGTPKAMFTSSDSTNGARVDGVSWTQSGGFSSWANIVSTSSNDNIVTNEMTASPNNDDINEMQDDRDHRLRSVVWNGSAWGTLITTNLSTTTINTTTGASLNKSYTQKPFQYAFTPYSAFSRDWRFYSDASASGDPSLPIAAQDTQPSLAPNAAFRLRLNIQEMSGGNLADTRKKLQYSSGAGCPDSITCTWTDVGAQGSGAIWRYYNGGATDDTTVGSAQLSSTTDLGKFYENGTSSTTDTPGSGSIEEFDFALQNNGATVNTTYYFRAYDYGPSASGGSMTNINAIPREQVFNTAGTEQTNCSDGTNSITCTYPNVLTSTGAPQAPQWVSVPGGTLTPQLQLRSIDLESDYIDYVIEYCTVNSWPCSATGGVFCQLSVVSSPTCTGDQSNWTGQDANSNTAYIGSTSLSGSTIANFQMPSGNLQANTTYYLRAKAIDPGGSNTYSAYSSTTSTTTAAYDILIRGGTCIGGVVPAGGGTNCTAGSGSVIQKVQIGN